ncbi:CHAT domain-containing protein [Actinomadura litoris]|uniref:CHAT domain-containing protein n=1 Tax=Actinomadura litoris TaxID=2678616 RepID=A0A7K1KXY4_9ACTN|nr:CHAT domain-containing protein [Actinomadura litoris]MUN36923.1 CHAT domain-containing protein [Actinomadura litoris]
MEISLLRKIAVLGRQGERVRVDDHAAHVAMWIHYYRAQALSVLETEPGSAASEELAIALGMAVHVQWQVWEALPSLLRKLLEVAHLPEPDLDALELRDQLIVVLHGQWQQSGALDALVGAVELWRGVLTGFGHGDHTGHRTWFGSALADLGEAVGDLELLDEAIEVLRDVAEEAEDANGAIALNNLGLAYLRRDGDGDLDRAIEAFGRAAAVAPPGSDDRSLRLSNLGGALLERAERGGRKADYHAAIAARRAAAAAPGQMSWSIGLAEALRKLGETGDVSATREAIEIHARLAMNEPDSAMQLAGLAFEATGLAQQTRDDTDVERAIALLRTAMARLGVADRVRRDVLVKLAEMLGHIYVAHQDADVLDEAIGLLREIRSEEPGEWAPHRTVLLGQYLCWRFVVENNEGDLDEAISLLRDSGATDPSRTGESPAPRAALAAALAAKAERTGDIGLLDQAIDVLGDAISAALHSGIELKAEGQGFKDTARMSQARWLRRRYELRPELRSLEQAITVWQEVVREREDDPVALAALADDLCRFHDHTGRPEALTEAIRLLNRARAVETDNERRDSLRRFFVAALIRRYAAEGRSADFENATEILDGHRDPASRVQLGSLWGHRGTRSGDLTHINTAVELLRAALNELTEPVMISWCADNLGSALLERFEQTGETSALDEAVRAFRQAHKGAPSAPEVISNLGNALCRRYERTGDDESLREALKQLREGARLLPDGHKDMVGLLHNLGGVAERAAVLDGDAELAEEAVRILEHAVALSDPAPATVLSTLGSALCSWSESGGGMPALTEALGVHRRACEAAETDRVTWRGLALNRAAALIDYATRGSAPDALDEAIDLLRQVVMEGGEGAPRSMAMNALAEALRARRRPGDLVEAIDHYRTVCLSSAPSTVVRLHAGRQAGALATGTGTFDTASDSFRHAIALLDEVAWRGLEPPDRERLLSQFSGLASDAAACELERGDPYRAVELLEQGRGVLLTQLLDLWSPLRSVRELDPELAAAYADVLSDLERPEHRHDADARTVLANRHTELLRAIRGLGLPDPEPFGRPSTFAELVPAAAEGPVVIVNVSDLRCDALIIAGSLVHPVPLPALSKDAVGHRTSRFLEAISIDRSEVGHRLRNSTERVIIGTLRWLWKAIAEPVLAELDADVTAPARMWWCPTGLLTMLPLHAAGPYAEDGSGVGALDLTVPSYTPTLRSLIHCRRPRPPSGPRRPPLIVSLPDTPGADALVAARRESEILRRWRPDSRVLAAEDATVTAVRESLPDHAWVHFACHGIQTLARPGEGRLILHDGGLTVREISRLRLEDAEFAYLSACHTARGGTDLADEALTMVAALLMAGYRQSIGALWQVNDFAAAKVAEAVYGEISRGGSGADALRKAVLLRRTMRPSHPEVWAGFVHVGC